jgi:hypothetical protein
MFGGMWTDSRGKSLTRLALAFILLALLFIAAACGEQDASTSASTTVAAETTTTMTTTTTNTELTTTTTVELPTTTTATTVGVSADSLAYAKSLGGTSHEGEKLYFVIGASVETEEEAQALLEEATPRFGDMQSYFIVQLSDNFEGMEPGWWVVIEAYRSEPSAENLDFGRRGFPDAYVKQATVKTADPIPVYEDMVGGV